MIAYFCTREHSRLLKLSALGISPGISLKLIQKWPAYVVQCEETEIALEPDVAKNIYVWQTLRVLEPYGIRFARNCSLKQPLNMPFTVVSNPAH